MTEKKPQTTLHGSCHCGQVRFTVNTVLDKVVQCNCSICSKKGVLHHRVPPEQFQLLQGEDALQLYQFDSKEAKHWFCKYCGIHPFSNPRAAPDMISINVRCLDDVELAAALPEVIYFDGKNWEQAVAKLNQQLHGQR
ncbi:GFA family protein [Thiothrix nivea]|uniref:GFA family protein n=1 Tax=Thiothrix nivea TaxID=1031 RepID=UPI0005936594|nr:GFA family protein [Thiothrix nivea]